MKLTGKRLRTIRDGKNFAIKKITVLEELKLSLPVAAEKPIDC